MLFPHRSPDCLPGRLTHPSAVVPATSTTPPTGLTPAGVYHVIFLVWKMIFPLYSPLILLQHRRKGFKALIYTNSWSAAGGSELRRR